MGTQVATQAVLLLLANLPTAVSTATQVFSFVAHGIASLKEAVSDKDVSADELLACSTHRNSTCHDCGARLTNEDPMPVQEITAREGDGDDFPLEAMPGFLFIESGYRDIAARAWVAEIVLGSGEVPLKAETLSFCELLTQWILNGASGAQPNKLRVIKDGALNSMQGA